MAAAVLRYHLAENVVDGGAKEAGCCNRQLVKTKNVATWMHTQMMRIDI